MRFIDEVDVKDKKILLRVDFNVDLDDSGKILSDFRIRAVLPTINYLLEKGISKIILVSHLGKPKGRDLKLSLKSISEHLFKLLNKTVVFVESLEDFSKIMESDLGKEKIFVLENLRFYPEEEVNNEDFAKRLSNVADIFVNDAFGVCHRNNASVVAITKFLPSFGGLLLRKEVENLNHAFQNVQKPLVLILGGAKISTKLPLIQKFSSSADVILLGGAIINTILKAWKFKIGKSFVEDEMLDEAAKIKADKAEILMPGDLLIGASLGSQVSIIRRPNEIGDGDWILDIGPEAAKAFIEAIKKAGTIIWNGPMGYFENLVFASGTKLIAQAIADSSAFSIVGGGETLTILENLNLMNKMKFVSTGGGAMLSYLAGEEMPGLKALS